MSDAGEREVDKSRFVIDLPDGETLERGATVEHRDYGPMEVEQISISGFGGKRARLSAVLTDEPRELIELSADAVRDAWGETMSYDPAAVHDDTSIVGFRGVTDPDLDAPWEPPRTTAIRMPCRRCGRHHHTVVDWLCASCRRHLRRIGILPAHYASPDRNQEDRDGDPMGTFEDRCAARQSEYDPVWGEDR